MKTMRNWFWGIFLLLAAAVLIVGQVTGFARLGFWSILAAVLLAAAFVQSLARLNFPGVFISAALVYSIFQKPLELLYISPWLLVLAGLLAGLGLNMIVRPKRRWYVEEYSQSAPCGAAPGPSEAPAPSGQGGTMALEAGDDPNHPHVRVSFGDTSRYIHGQAVETGFFEVNLGHMSVYFDGARPAPGGLQITVGVSLGALDLYFPRAWSVRENVSTTLAGVNHAVRGAAPGPEAPQVMISGGISLGALEIHYI